MKVMIGNWVANIESLRSSGDEAHFWLNGYVNKQNCRIWSEANPQVYVETPLHPEKRTAWCALWAGGIIGPYFFKNDEGHNVTVNGDRYRAMMNNFFISKLNNHDVQELGFQQDGATCHTSRATIDLLKDTFGDRLISRFGPVNWPPRSCDLTPLDYFLWGYVKSLVYADKPQTLDHLEDNIRRVIADIRPQLLEKVIENWTSRLDYIRASRGSPMPEIIFKIIRFLSLGNRDFTEYTPPDYTIHLNQSHQNFQLFYTRDIKLAAHNEPISDPTIPRDSTSPQSCTERLGCSKCAFKVIKIITYGKIGVFSIIADHRDALRQEPTGPLTSFTIGASSHPQLIFNTWKNRSFLDNRWSQGRVKAGANWALGLGHNGDLVSSSNHP
ncbi:putative transposable element [Trichonephila clavipes]|nr:putative transposable element [Trichonephila clavipes]